MVLDKPLSNLQVELLKTFSHNLDKDDLIAIKRMLANFFAEKASEEFDKVWEEKGWSNDKMDNLLAHSV